MLVVTISGRNLALGMILFVILSAVTVLLAPDLWDRGKVDDVADVDLALVAEAARRANSSYHTPEQIRDEFGEAVEIGEFPESGARVVVDSSGDLQWVTVRGTANIANAYADLKFAEKFDHELRMNVHAGFDRAARECLPWLLERIDPERPVRLIGHSLGGAMAALLHAILESRGFVVLPAVTFGQPKITDAEGAAALAHLELLRIIHDDDPVPLVPPVVVGVSKVGIYHHFGPEVILEPNGRFYYLSQHEVDRMDVADYWSNLLHLRPDAHDMGKGYQPALTRARERAGK